MDGTTSSLQQLFASFGRMSSRERTLVGITAVAALLFVVVGAIYLVDTRLERAGRRLAERREQLRQILSLEGEYRAAQQETQRIKQQLEHNNTQLFSFLPKVAERLGLTLNDLNERRTPLKDTGVDEISVDINLRKMTLDKLDAFLQDVEGGASGGMVKVLKITVKTRFDNEQLLDVNMKVATYKPSENG